MLVTNAVNSGNPILKGPQAMAFIVNATALLAGPETIVKANSLREAYEQGNATPGLPDTPVPFSLENAEWSFI